MASPTSPLSVLPPPSQATARMAPTLHELPRITPFELGLTPRTAVFGNSGSGKSTLARLLAHRRPFPVLDLDSLVWEPRRIAVRRPEQAVLADLKAFTDHHPGWIIEGCYGDLIEALLPLSPELIFLNPGRDACIEHCRQRPHEAHKYTSKEDQDQRLGFLLDWVAGYYTRSDSLSLAAHRRVFDSYEGPKRELLTPVELLTELPPSRAAEAP